MLRKDLNYLALTEGAISKIKWECRRNGRPYIGPRARYVCNPLGGVPNEWCQLIWIQIKKYPQCQKAGISTSRWHMKYAHGISLPHIARIWEHEIKPTSTIQCKEIKLRNGEIRAVRIPRAEIYSQLQPILRQHLAECMPKQKWD